MLSSSNTQTRTSTPTSFTFSPTFPSTAIPTPKSNHFIRPPAPSKIHVLKFQFQHDKSVLGPSLLGSSETPLLQTRFADALEYAGKRESLAGRRARMEGLPFPVRVDSGMGWPVLPKETEQIVEADKKEVKWCADAAVQERRAQLRSMRRENAEKQNAVYRIEGSDVVDQFGRVYGQVGKRKVDVTSLFR